MMTLVIMFFMIIIIGLADGPPQRGPTQLIKPKFTEHYFTEEALPC